MLIQTITLWSIVRMAELCCIMLLSRDTSTWLVILPKPTISQGDHASCVVMVLQIWQVEYLIQEGADINCRNWRGVSMLWSKVWQLSNNNWPTRRQIPYITPPSPDNSLWRVFFSCMYVSLLIFKYQAIFCYQEIIVNFSQLVMLSPHQPLLL